MAVAEGVHQADGFQAVRSREMAAHAWEKQLLFSPLRDQLVGVDENLPNEVGFHGVDRLEPVLMSVVIHIHIAVEDGADAAIVSECPGWIDPRRPV